MCLVLPPNVPSEAAPFTPRPEPTRYRQSRGQGQPEITQPPTTQWGGPGTKQDSASGAATFAARRAMPSEAGSSRSSLAKYGALPRAGRYRQIAAALVGWGPLQVAGRERKGEKAARSLPKRPV